MSQPESVGRAVPEWSGYDRPTQQRAELSLCEAASVSGRSVEELKRAIRAGGLRAERRGWWRIRRGDLDEYLHG